MIPSILQATLSLILQSVVTLAVMLLLINDPANPQVALFLASILSPNSGLVGVLMNPAFWLTNIPLSTAMVVTLLLVAVLGGGWVYSSEYGMYLEAWNSEDVPMSSVLSNGSKRWKSMAWTLLLSNLVTWGPASIGFLLIIASAANVNGSAGLVARLAASSVFQPLLFASLVLSMFTAYSYPAVPVDAASGIGSIRRIFRVACNNLALALTSWVLRLVLQSLHLT